MADNLTTHRLMAPFWDGKRIHPAGELVDFPAGGAPKGSKELTKAEANTERAERAEAHLDPTERVLAAFRADITALEARIESLEGE